jgi:hypothetical protein
VVPEQRYAGGWRPSRRSAAGLGSPGTTEVGATQRRALTGGAAGLGSVGGFYPRGADPLEVDDRVLYRRPDARPDTMPDRPREPVQPELVDGVPVYRIYRPRPVRPIYPYGGNGRAD